MGTGIGNVVSKLATDTRYFPEELFVAVKAGARKTAKVKKAEDVNLDDLEAQEREKPNAAEDDDDAVALEGAEEEEDDDVEDYAQNHYASDDEESDGGGDGEATF
jgi:hypothetical protein